MKTQDLLTLTVAALGEQPARTPCLGCVEEARGFQRASASRSDVITDGDLMSLRGVWGILRDPKKTKEYGEDGAEWYCSATLSPPTNGRERLAIVRAMLARWVEQSAHIARLDADDCRDQARRDAERDLRRDIITRIEAAIALTVEAMAAYAAAKTA